MPRQFWTDAELNTLFSTLGTRIEFTNPDGYTRGVGSDLVYGVFTYEQDTIIDQLGLRAFPEDAALLRVKSSVASEMVPGTEVTIDDEVWVVRADLKATEGDGTVVALGIIPSGSL